MKKVLVVLLLIFPLVVNAQEYINEGAGVTFEVNDEWTEQDLSSEREYIDIKWINNDCGVLMFGTGDIWNEMSTSEKQGLSRKELNYNMLTEADLATYRETLTNAGYNISNAKFTNFKLKFMRFSGTADYNGNQVDYLSYITLNNGYMIQWQYYGNMDSTCSIKVPEVVNTMKSTINNTNGGGYMNDLNTLTIIISLALTIICYMAYPFIRIKLMNAKYDEKSCKKMILWNSIIVALMFALLSYAIDESNGTSSAINFAPAVLYYYINKAIWLSRFKDKKQNSSEDNKEQEQKKVYKCSKCGESFDYDFDVCPSCKFDFSNNKKIDDEVDEANSFTCDNCGSAVSEDAEECPNCGCTFIEKEEETTEEKFVCDNCGSLVSASEKKCPKCGESFEEENELDENAKLSKNKSKEEKNETDMDKKYADLNKLKKLLDKDIITKEEFEKEKKKILKD